MLLDIVLLVALIVLPLAWFFDPLQGDWGRVSWGWKPVLAPLLVLVIRSVIKQRSKRPVRGWAEAALFKKLAFAWLMPFLFLAGLEGVLALAGVEKAPVAPIVIRGEEDIDTKRKRDDSKVILDPELLWRFYPNAQWGGVRINEHGYRTRPFALAKEPGMRRVIALGDSCTAQGEPPYSDRLHALLQAEPPSTNQWEAFNMGVFGYSIEQGYRQFKKEGLRLQPDVVTFYFGWNDHWLYEKPDKLRLATRMSPAMARVTKAVQNKRIFAVLTKRVKTKDEPVSTNRVYRVSLEDYGTRISNLVEAIRSTGATPLLITGARRDLTPSVVKSGHARDPDVAEAAHDQYNEVARSVAQSLNIPILDLAQEFSGPEFDHYFSRDGIHFEDPGLDAIATRLHDKLKELAAAGQLP